MGRRSVRPFVDTLSLCSDLEPLDTYHSRGFGKFLFNVDMLLRLDDARDDSSYTFGSTSAPLGRWFTRINDIVLPSLSWDIFTLQSLFTFFQWAWREVCLQVSQRLHHHHYLRWVRGLISTLVPSSSLVKHTFLSVKTRGYFESWWGMGKECLTPPPLPHPVLRFPLGYIELFH